MEEISSMAIVKRLDKHKQVTIMLKLKFISNRATVNATNNTQETFIFDPKEMIGILDPRSLGYYNIRQGVLQQNLSKYYHSEPADALHEQFNKSINTMKKEKEESKEKYPWLDSYINLDNSCLTDREKTEVRDFLYEYKDVFSLRDKIGTCPNKEVQIDVTDKRPFFIRSYHAKEEDKNTLDKEMKRLHHLGILKKGFSAYSSPVMLISRKVTQDERIVTDFSHLNMWDS